MISASWSRSATYSSPTTNSYDPCFSLPKELEIKITFTATFPANGGSSTYTIYGYNNGSSGSTKIASKSYNRTNTVEYIISGYDSIRIQTKVQHSTVYNHSNTATHKFSISGVINS